MMKQLQKYLDTDYLTDEHLAGFDNYKVSFLFLLHFSVL